MNVAYCLTRNYYNKAAPSMRSLLEHNPDARIYVIGETDDFPLPIYKIINISGSDYLKKSGPNYNYMLSRINFYRPIYADLIPEDKLIHMDADTIICDDITPLWDTDLSGKWYGAVPEYKGNFRPYGPIYYNMGVSVLNLAQMRQDDAPAQLLHLINTSPLVYPDQDVFNMHVDKAVTVDVRYNETTVTGWTDNPAVVHYAGYTKWYDDKYMPRRAFLDKYIPPIE